MPGERVLRPQPAPDPQSKPFWDAAAEGRLVVQRCASCGHYDHPPFPVCTRCRSGDVAFQPVSGEGTVFARTVVESPVVPGFEDLIPYTALVVELDEQAGLLVAAQLSGDAPDAPIGRRVTMTVETLNERISLPQFVPQSSEKP